MTFEGQAAVVSVQFLLIKAVFTAVVIIIIMIRDVIVIKKLLDIILHIKPA